jgi:integrase
MSRAMAPTTFMVSLKNKMMSGDRAVAETSAHKYIMDLVNINDKNVFNSLKFLKDKKEEIMKSLEDYADTTKAGLLTSIVSALNQQKDQHLYKSIHKFYSEQLKEARAKLDGIDTSIKTDKQETNWMEWSEIQNVWNELDDEVNLFKNQKSITNKQFETLVDWVVLSLFVLTEPRRNRDYQDMAIIVKNVKADTLKLDTNYIDLNNEQFIFNTYKTAKTYKQQVLDIPKKLMDVINVWVKHYPSLNTASRKDGTVPFLVNSMGNKQNAVNYITLRLNKILGKKIGSSMLRHIYISHKFGPVIAEQMEVAEKMGHSVEEQKSYNKV